MPKNVEDADKSVTKTVSLSVSDWKKIDARPEGRSGYLRTLVDQDLNGGGSSPNPTAENILVELCERLRPERASHLRDSLAALDLPQVVVLGKILESLTEELAAHRAMNGNLGANPLVLLKLLREDAHALQAAYAFRQLPPTAERLARMFDPAFYQELGIAAALNATRQASDKLKRS